MRRAVLVLALLGGAVFAAPAASQHPGGDATAGAVAPAGSSPAHTASIGFDSVAPRRLDIVRGETVTWTNDSVRTHTVTADDASFDSGRLSASETYMRRFSATGEAAYHCELHPSIQGVVGVHDLLLDAPAQPAAPKRPYPLSGRAALPQGTPVSIEADTGSGFAEVASSTIGDDGQFAARIVPEATVSLRAVAGGVTSPSVNLLVLDRRIALTVRRLSGGRVRLQVNVTPAARGGRIVLQLFLPERFGWWPVRQAKLGRTSRASFTLHPKRRLQARVRYTLADGATALATSRTVRVGPPPRTARAGHHG